ncbi:MAG: hypothetical protein ACLQBQ_06235 [Smithella sp.]
MVDKITPKHVKYFLLSVLFSLLGLGMGIFLNFQSNPVAYAQTQYPQAQSSSTELRFNYDYQSGPFVRRMSGTVKDPQGLWNALKPLQSPHGAHGDYGMIGDDKLLGKEPGYGLRQLDKVARRYLTFETFYFKQPSRWEKIGVQSGTFTDADTLNDASLGWAFFDVRGKFEADLKQLLKLHPSGIGSKTTHDRTVAGIINNYHYE